MRSRAERISRALVRRYPRAWRERYGEEMLVLIDDAGSTWKHTLDIAVGCMDAWLRALTRLNSPNNWFAALLGGASVRLCSAIAIHFGWIPSAPLRIAFQGAFAFIVLFLFGSVFLLGFLVVANLFRRAWNQWFGMIHGHMPEQAIYPLYPQLATDRMKAITDFGVTRRQIRMIAAVTVLIAIGVDISTPDKTVGEFLRLPHYAMPFPVVPWLTYWMLGNARMFLMSLRVLRVMVSERRPSRVE